MILSAFCETSGVLQTFYYINMIVKALCYIVPAILVLMVTIDMIKNVIAGDEDKIKKNLRTIIKRMSFAVMVFFVPILVNFAFGLLGDLNVSAAKCYENATLDKIEYYKEKEEKEYADYQEQRKAEIEAIRKEQQDAVRKAMEAAASSSGGAAAITKVAFETAWGTNQKSTSRSKPTDTFKKYLNKYYPKHNNWSSCAKTGKSCDVYVGTVIRASGYDKSYPRGLAEQITYLAKSSKWKKINTSNTVKESQLKSGDVIVYSHSSGAHTLLYVKKGNTGYRAEASLCDYYGRLSKFKSPFTKTKLRVYRAVS